MKPGAPVSTPDVPDDRSILEFDASRGTVGQLMEDLLRGKIATPVWIRVGPSRHKVTGANKEAFVRGLLCALEITALLEEKR